MQAVAITDTPALHGAQVVLMVPDVQDAIDIDADEALQADIAAAATPEAVPGPLV